MKLLFDQNISFRIINKIQDLYPGSKQVQDFGLVKGSSPKIIWLRPGNTSTQNIEIVLRKNYDVIQTFLTDPNYKDIGCLEINS